MPWGVKNNNNNDQESQKKNHCRYTMHFNSFVPHFLNNWESEQDK